MDVPPAGVFAVQCPRCRKFMLVEDHDRGRTVPCLVCKSPLAVPAPGRVLQPPPPPRRM